MYEKKEDITEYGLSFLLFSFSEIPIILNNKYDGSKNTMTKLVVTSKRNGVNEDN